MTTQTIIQSEERETYAEMGNEAWEFLFSELKGNVPEALTEGVLERLASFILAVGCTSSAVPAVGADAAQARKLKTIYDKMAGEGGGTWAAYMLMEIKEYVSMIHPLPSTEPSEAMVEAAQNAYRETANYPIVPGNHNAALVAALRAALNESQSK